MLMSDKIAETLSYPFLTRSLSIIFTQDYITGTATKAWHSLFSAICIQKTFYFLATQDQCKCMIHKNLFLKLEAMGISYDSSFWEKALCSTESNSDCWLSKCEQCNKGRNMVSAKPCNSSSITLKQWEKAIAEKKQPTRQPR